MARRRLTAIIDPFTTRRDCPHQDSGYSTFDAYRTPQGIPRQPGESVVQGVVQTPNEDDRMKGCYPTMTEYEAQNAFDLKWHRNGQSTYDFADKD